MMATTKEEKIHRLENLVKALRSGEYKQIKNQLKSDNGYCCLGVACDLFLKETDQSFWEGNTFGYSYERYILPQEVADFYGFRTRNPSNLQGVNLSNKNDNGASFEEIANDIEEIINKIKET